MRKLDVEYGKENTFDLGGGLELSITITYDEYPESPREWENFGHMACWHRRYNLGDEQPTCDPSEWMESLFEENEDYRLAAGAMRRKLARLLAKDRKASKAEATRWFRRTMSELTDRLDYIFLPLYLLDHSGLWMNCTGFSYCDPGNWDSGQVGWIYAAPVDIVAEYGAITPETKAKAIKLMMQEVETYSDYLSGNVHEYFWEIARVTECSCCGQDNREIVAEDSCCGFIGDTDYMVSDINIGLKEYGVEVEL